MVKNNQTFGLVSSIPLELFKRLSAAGAVTPVIASANNLYDAGTSHGWLYIYNNSTKIVIIPTKGITVGSNQRTEIVLFERYTGGTLNENAVSLYQRFDASETGIINIPRIVLKPGERLQIWAFNRAPAAPAIITFSITYYEMEARIYDKFIAQQRYLLEQEVQTI